MKRIISLCCVVMILFISVAVPANAAEVAEADSNWFNVLDYTTVDGSKNYVEVDPGANAIDVSLPYRMGLYYIDMLVASDAVFTSVSVTARDSTEALTVDKISSRLYRIYGKTPSKYVDTFTLNFNISSGAYINFLQLRTFRAPADRFDVEASLDIISSTFEDTIHYVPTDDINYRMFTASEAYDDTWFICYVSCEDWRMYDYLDYQFMFDVFEITSISAVMGSENVPLDFSYTDGANIDGNTYYVTMRLDLTELNRASDDFPMIVIMGRLHPGVQNSIDFANASGFVLTNTVNPLQYYFTMLRSWISSQTSDLRSAILNGSSSVASSISLLKTALGTMFESLETKLSGHFANLNQWLNNQTLAIGGFFSDQTTAIEAEFTSLKKAIKGHFTDLNGWIEDQTATLEAAIRGDTAPGNKFQDKVSDKDDELDDMAEVMDSVTKPAIKDINVSVNKYVKPADMQLLATPLNAFFEADLFRTMIIMSILLATVSFTLYGKR